MVLLFAIFMVVTFVLAAYHYWRQLDERQEAFDWFQVWAIRGIVVPAALWMFFNAGLFHRMPSLVPELDVATGKAWFSTYLSVSATGLITIGIFWLITTMAMILSQIGFLTKERRGFLLMLGVWALAGCLFESLFLYFLGLGAGICFVLVWPFLLAYATIGMAETTPPVPIYSRAVARVQMGKYEDAEAEVLHELEKDESDYQGWLMLADLYANHFNDLPAADRTIHEICQDPRVTVSQISEALNKLADWYLKVSYDPAAARRALEEVCQRLPGTHLAKMARMRIYQLPPNKEAMQKPARSIPLRHIETELDAPSPSTNAATPEESTAKANALVEKLKAVPGDIKLREELAQIFAEQLDKVELALEQMELLLALPNIPARQCAEWLNRMALWLVRFRRDEAGAQVLLERLIRDYPQTVEAFTAQRRLSFMRQEVKVRRLRTYLSDQ